MKGHTLFGIFMRNNGKELNVFLDIELVFD